MALGLGMRGGGDISADSTRTSCTKFSREIKRGVICKFLMEIFYDSFDRELIMVE